jgi:2,3-diketo-5-methylthio-1-phosphopentane phosphatase
VTADPALAGVQAILLDVEGTTTPMAFVSEVLFPYARRQLRSHLERNATSPEYEGIFSLLRTEYAVDRRSGEPVPPWVDSPRDKRLACIASYVEWLMDRDRKSTALKALQGRIWEEGYAFGELVGAVFADVPGALQRWSDQHVGVGIFSSGSVLAQKLLFGNSAAGDLTKFLRWHFDTTTGAKTDAASYRRIAATMAVAPGDILFASDVTRELDAAHAAGMQTRLSVRPGNAPQPHDHGYRVVRTFDEL